MDCWVESNSTMTSPCANFWYNDNCIVHLFWTNKRITFCRYSNKLSPGVSSYFSTDTFLVERWSRSILFIKSKCVLYVYMKVLIHLFISLDGTWSVYVDNNNSNLVFLDEHHGLSSRSLTDRHVEIYFSILKKKGNNYR
jgi:hypothetical protein